MTVEAVQARYDLAAKIVVLVKEMKILVYGQDFAERNWNATIINWHGGSLEDFIMQDIFLSTISVIDDGVQERIKRLKVQARDRIALLFQENRLLVAELELSSLS